MKLPITARQLIATLMVGLAALLALPHAALAEQNVHHLVFMSDFHSTEGSIQNALTGMPEDVEYVSLVGDMVGGRGNMTPPYDSNWILQQAQDVYPTLGSANVSIIWASHDKNVNDDAGIVKCPGGYGSTAIYQGVNDDGSVAYYIYAIGFDEMMEGGSVSKDAANAFKSWVGGLERTAPVIVLCHAPMQAKRGDNRGALYWSEALNYAATGVEGITSTGTDATIVRNVIFLCGHNHTVTKDEYYFAAGGTMDVQIDTSGNDNSYTPASLQAQGETIYEMDVQDEELEEEEDVTLEARPPRHKAEGVTSDIYYTSLVAGYLKDSGNATLLTISDEAITLEKRNAGNAVSLGINGVTSEVVEGPVVLKQFSEANVPVHDSITITKVNENGKALDGATFTLYRDDEALASYEGGTFTISTSDEGLAAALPGTGESLTLTLRESTAPEGYELSSDAHALNLSASSEETLVDRVFTTTTTYTLDIDGADTLTVANVKATPEEEPDVPVDGTDKPDAPHKQEKPSRRALQKLPQTGDELHIWAAPLALTLAGCILLATGEALRRRA